MNKTFEENFQAINRLVGAEGVVLLKNEHNTLPLKDTDIVSLFGRCQIDYYRSGTGSGGAVNTKYSINALEGLRDTTITLNETLINIYKDFIQKNPFDKGNGYWGSEPWSQKEMHLDDQIVKTAANSSNKAIIFIGRTAGEDKDHYLGQGSLLLTDEELHMLDVVTKYFNKVVLVYNVGNIIDMSYLSKYDDKIDSILYAWQGGMEGGNALADILTGKVNPSGKLPDTIIKNIKEFPTNKNFGDALANFYQEDIYLGYRYFETFDRDKVLYPFGYGLSYTKFSSKVISFNKSETELFIEVFVKNEGKIDGKEVIQIYSQAPQGVLGKPSVELVGFKKTHLIKAGNSDIIKITIPLYQLSSYDDFGYINKSSYILESGRYNIYLGKDSRNILLVDSFTLEDNIILDTSSECLAPLKPFKRIKPGLQKPNGEYEIAYTDVPLRSVNLSARMNDNLPKTIEHNEKILNLKDVLNNQITMNEFISTLSKEQLALIVLGEGMSHPLVTSGTAAAFGGLYPELSNVGIPATCAADGPSGLRMDTGGFGTQMPIGTLIASTWNQDLIKELYTYEGQELLAHNVDTLLGPGMNIHRNPMCGRNFEYFSEDPLLTGKIASSIVKGIREGGSEATLKHLAANDQEAHRFDVDTVASERCLREIHLKAFEITIKETNPISIMTSYNPINGHHTASNYDLNTTVLRKEWGFDGLVMTDWWTKLNHTIIPDQAEKHRVTEMIKSQNDLYMVIPNGETKTSLHYQDILKNLEMGYLSLGELQRSVKNILNFILKTKAISRQTKETEILYFNPIKNIQMNHSKYSNSISFNTRESKSDVIYVDETKVYSVFISIRNDSSDLSQSACNLLINNHLLTNIQLKGNTLDVVEKEIAKVNLQKGYYNITIDFIKPGLEVLSLTFK